MGDRRKPNDPYRHIHLSDPATGNLTFVLSPEPSAPSLGLSRHPNDTLHRPRSEPTSPKISHRSLLRSSTISSSMQGQRQQTSLAPIGRPDTMYPATQGRQSQSIFSPPRPPLPTLPPPQIPTQIPTQWQLSPSRISGTPRGQQYPRARKYQNRLPPPTSAPSSASQIWNQGATQPQVPDQFLSYQDQTSLVIGLLSHLDRLTTECEDMRAFIRLGYIAQEVRDGTVAVRKEVEEYVTPNNFH
jgi:hypothetical protein